MANTYPSQTRTIDPYEEYNSNIANRLTRLATNNQNCLHRTHGIDVEIDTTNSATQLLVSEGICFKDDVLIQIDSQFTVDMSESDFYVSTSGGYWNEAGYYYIVLSYTYVKSKPAPQAAIKIIKPSQHALLTSAYLFLKAVYVTFNGATFEIDSVSDYDPGDPLVAKRIYAPLYVGVFDTLPTFVQEDHEGMLIYVRHDQALYWGKETVWEKIDSGLNICVTTTGCSVGQIGYISIAADRTVVPAIATSTNTLGSCVVTELGTYAAKTGFVRVYGLTENVLVEAGIDINSGDKVYLSQSENGKITNVEPTTFGQFLGYALLDSTSGSVDILFQPDSMFMSNEISYIRTFIGKGASGSETPSYSSVNHIVQNTSLETAIGAIDDLLMFSAESVAAADGDSTPSVLNGSGKVCSIMTTSNSATTTITNFDDGINNQGLVLLTNDYNTYIQHGSYIKLADNVDATSSTGFAITFVKLSGRWYEIGRQGTSTGPGPSSTGCTHGAYELSTPSATPSVATYNVWYTNAGAADTYTDFSDGYPGQRITIIFLSSNCVVQNGTTIQLQGSSDFYPTTGSTLSLVYSGSKWYEEARMIP